ncbi:uncharacterized protein LOC110453148 [Mizuhopecten yessoensis]|uniref:uncharacterized protein LOC110453148 n=1 Tax=Mizuhopecten yessoensis TaxID=6573 RepID=UPI000B45A0E9|nr:uncharacterized protein LOC110453148 [Mizuhopecten yessoensis]
MKEALPSFVFLLFDLLRTINAATHTDMIRLYQNLTKDYKKNVRQTFNQSHPTKVNFSFNLLSIKELDEKTSKLSIVGIKEKRSRVCNTLVPTCIIGLLNVLVFLIPAESGERVSFSITVLFAMAVFMTIVTDSLPSNSEPNGPRLCYLLSIDLDINALVTVCAILGMRLYHKPDHQEIDV